MLPGELAGYRSFAEYPPEAALEAATEPEELKQMLGGQKPNPAAQAGRITLAGR